jgi:hypothetical protein
MQWMRAKVIVANGVTSQSVEEVRQVVKYDAYGYPSPPQWEVVRTLTEDEAKQLGISFAEEKG